MFWICSLSKALRIELVKKRVDLEVALHPNQRKFGGNFNGHFLKI